jgi:voltage-gated potassium channel
MPLESAAVPVPRPPEFRHERSWQLIVVLATALLAALTPLTLVFGMRTLAGYLAVYATVTAVLAADTFIAMSRWRRADAERTAEKDWRWRGWLLVDLVAAIPFAVLFGSPFLELLRMVKLAKVGRYMREWRLDYLRFSNQLRFAFLVFWMGLVAHWIACGWVAISGARTGADGELVAYINAFYWTVTTLATVGYGDIAPANPAQRLYAVGTIVLGVGFFGYLLGLIASIWAKRDPARTRFEESIERLSMAVKYGHLPHHLQHRIYEFHRYMWQQRLGYSEAEFLKELPRNLRAEVSLHLKRDLLQKCDLFVGADANFVREVAVHLRPIVLTPGDIVFRGGDVGDEMFFIVNGAVDVLAADGARLARMGPGDFFGEIALVQDVPRTATVEAVTYCDVYTLSRNAFETVVVRYPEILRRLQAEGAARRERNNGFASRPE